MSRTRSGPESSASQPDVVEKASQRAKPAKRKAKRQRYSKGNFAATTVGPHGAAVRIYERDGSGTAWISYVWEGKPVKRSLATGFTTPTGRWTRRSRRR